VEDVAAAVVSEVGPLETMKLEKLLYYCQAWHLAITDRRIFLEPIEAWVQGPVIRAIYDRHRGRRRVSNWSSGDEARVPKDARAVISLVCAHYGGLSGDDLSTLTHSELPWQLARGGISATARSNAEITATSMATYYRARELGSRTAADLAAGGIALTRGPMSDAGKSQYREALAELRESYRKSAEHAPEVLTTDAGQFTQPSERAKSRLAELRRERDLASQ
jgi:uncharacterized phage-associated protein